MAKVRIIIDDLSPRREQFSLWSIIYVKVNETCFPDDAWSDATSSVLVIWNTNTYKLLCGCAKYCELPFMDGDFEIKLTATEKRLAQMSLCQDENEIEHFDDVDLLYFVRQLIAASTKVLEYDKLTGKEQSVEMNTLANSLEKLRKKYMEFSP